MASEAQLKNEIERLTASINNHKSSVSTQPKTTTYPYRKNTYVNPNYKQTNKYTRPTPGPSGLPRSYTQPAPAHEPKDVVLDGVAFSSSGRSLVRKDLPKPPSSSAISTSKSQSHYERKSGHLIAANRAYKPQSSRGRRGAAPGRNMTLTNKRRPYQTRRASKRKKLMNKQCPRFSTTGSCAHGLTCMYQHDPSKIAICWKFLQDNCPNTAETCNLSHDPTPERTPLCMHFLQKGRCTRQNCLFPHVNVGARNGVCRDFAVLGYCEKGLECDQQHVRECPDFAEKGTCSTKGCKLPHVIRANRNRKPVSNSAATASTTTTSSADSTSAAVGTEGDTSIPHLTADDAQMGDEYISLTFNESESSEDDEDDVDDNDDEGEEESEEDEEGDDPNDVADVPVIG